ncbi:MAG TPA: hypothetical protein VHO90_06850, partial [Bacteroidales bacterium]|nr:hypothetical protein [Bacteroidales bacterium]
MKTTRVLLFILLLVLPNVVFAQNTDLSSVDLSTIKVDELSDDQIRQIVTRMEENGYTLDQLEPVALSRGMSASEFQKLKNRVAQ